MSARYHLIPNNDNDNVSTDSSMIDFDNNQLQQSQQLPMQVMYGQMPNIIPNNNIIHIPNANIDIQIQSPIIRHNLHYNIIKIIFINSILASAGLALNIGGYIDTNSINNIQIFNIDIKYICNYFGILIIFYIIYISINILIFAISYIVSINNNNTNEILFINSIIFQLNLILRILLMGIIIDIAVNNTPMMILNIPNISNISNIPDNKINIYMPKYLQYMIIETIIYTIISFVIGYSNGIIKFLIY